MPLKRKCFVKAGKQQGLLQQFYDDLDDGTSETIIWRIMLMISNNDWKNNTFESETDTELDKNVLFNDIVILLIIHYVNKRYKIGWRFKSSYL